MPRDGMALRRELRDPIARCAAGELPPNVALAQLAAAAQSSTELEQALLRGAQTFDADRPNGGAHLYAAYDLWMATPDAWSVLRRVLATAGTWQAAPPDDDGAVDRWAALFDRAAAISADAGVALYSLGRADLLAAATDEIVTFIRDRNLLGHDRVLVEIGCGHGRCLAALAGEVGFAIGLDVSRAMLAQARRRCAAHDNVALLRGSGRDLAALRDACADLLLAVDSFPYLVAAGVAADHMTEARRVLRPGGAVLILNYSYRGDPAIDRAELADLGGSIGFTLAVDGARPFRHWDGTAFLLTRR